MSAKPANHDKTYIIYTEIVIIKNDAPSGRRESRKLATYRVYLNNNKLFILLLITRAIIIYNN